MQEKEPLIKDFGYPYGYRIDLTQEEDEAKLSSQILNKLEKKPKLKTIITIVPLISIIVSISMTNTNSTISSETITNVEEINDSALRKTGKAASYFIIMRLLFVYLLNAEPLDDYLVEVLLGLYKWVK